MDSSAYLAGERKECSRNKIPSASQSLAHWAIFFDQTVRQNRECEHGVGGLCSELNKQGSPLDFWWQTVSFYKISHRLDFLLTDREVAVVFGQLGCPFAAVLFLLFAVCSSLLALQNGSTMQMAASRSSFLRLWCRPPSVLRQHSGAGLFWASFGGRFL